VLDATNLIDLELDISSPPVILDLDTPAKKARFQLKLLKGGFLGSYRGTMLDGTKWPKHWTLSSSIAGSDQPENWLPKEMSEDEYQQIATRLSEWLSMSLLGRSDGLILSLPATEEMLNDCERKNNLKIPSEYRRLLSITNGLDVLCDKPYTVAGTGDLRAITFNNQATWVVSDLNEYGVVVIKPNNENDSECLYINPTGKEEYVGDLRKYVLDTIKMLPSFGVEAI
jgi:hypothetical protein